MEFHGLTLDPFQIEACEHITKGDSVVVSASTGTGKTLVAEYAIEFYTAHGQRSVYTSPIKALSNQKYRDFVEQFGEDKVGILTGDVSINKDAQILVMTTEVYRNMALADPTSIQDVGILIMDEVHFMNDPERGTVWEESIIFSTDDVRFLALSATIPNADEFADWISSIHNHDVHVVQHLKRAVPLSHYLFMGENKLVPRDDITHYMNVKHGKPEYRSKGGRGKKGRKGKKKPNPPSHLALLRIMQEKGLLPCLFFVFSRKDCESKALETAYNLNLGTPDPRLQDIIQRHLSGPDLTEMDSIRSLIEVLGKGIAFHHAGMLPAAKRAVEEAFHLNLIKVLFATETFAVGINYPARSVAFAGMRKYDGTHHRYLNSKEYFQMAGRAGRRGMDEHGTVIAMVDQYSDDLGELRDLTSADRIPIFSQFQLSYNTVVNLLDKHKKNEIKAILENSFDSFRKRRSGKRVNVWASWNNRQRTLERYGYATGDNLTSKGLFTRRIFTEELLTTEVFNDKKWKNWDTVDIACLASAITYEHRFTRKRKRPKKERRFYRIMATIQNNEYLMKNLNFTGLAKRIPLVESWVEGMPFSQIVNDNELAEGDIIRIFRQAIDVMEQVRRATDQSELRDKLSAAIALLDKDVVSVSFD